MKWLVGLLLLNFGFLLNSNAVPPVLNYAGQVAVNGEAFDGNGLFKFALVNMDGNVTYWSNDGTSVDGSEPQTSVSVSVNGGLYAVLLGNTAQQGMGAIDPSIFNKHGSVKLRVWFSDGKNGFEHLKPDRPFAAVPYAFSAGTAETAGSATIAPGSIDRKMLSRDIRADLNSSLKKITRDMLPHSVLQDLNSSIKSIKRDMLPSSVLAQLDRKLTRADLPHDVLSDINSTIKLHRLSPEVLAALQISPSISTQPFARYDRSTGTAMVEVAGRGHNLSYQWFRGGQPIDGATAPVLELANPTLDDNATYAVLLTNSVGQAISQTLTLQQAIGAPGLPLEEANSTQVPRNGLVLWLDANDLNADGNEDSLVVGDRVASWTDKISKNKAEQGDLNKEPTKGISGIVFSLNHSLVIDDLNTSAKHIFIVGKRKYRQGWSFLIKGKDINQVRWYHNGSDISGDGGTTEFTYGTGGSRRISGGFTSLPLDETFIVTLTKGNHSLDGGLFADLTIGSGLDGEISEILFYDRFLQNNERDAVERYLSDKWNIQLHADKLTAEQAAYDAALPFNEPEDNLQAYYKFEPVSVEPDKLWDYSGGSRHLTLRNFSNNCWNEGVSGQSLSFDGINDYANRTTDLNFNFQTVSFWAKPKTPVDGRNDPNPVFFALNPGNGNHGKSLFFNYSKLGGSGHWMLVNHSGDDSYLETNSTELSPLFGWFHLSFTATQSDGNPSYNFYVNGESVPNTSSATAIGFMNGGDTNIGLQIGRGRELGYFEGSLDEFKIYDRILSPAEIEALYNSYQNPIIRTSGEHNATVGTNFSLSLTADNGPTTYLAEGLPTELSLNVTTGQITGTLSKPGYHRVFVKAMNEHGTGSDTIAIVARPPTNEDGWPLDIPSENDVPANKLALWLDADDVDGDKLEDNISNTTEIEIWRDKSSEGRHAKPSNNSGKPTYRQNVLNNLPVVRFSSDDNRRMMGSNHLFSFGAGEENGLTIIAVASSNDTTSNTSSRKLIDFGRNSATGWGVIFRKNGGSFFTPNDFNGTNVPFSLNKAPGEFSVGTFRVTFEQLQEVFVDGQLLAHKQTNLKRLTNDEITETHNRTGTSGPLTIGGASAGGGGSNPQSLYGDIAELLVWKRALTDSERVVVEQYLAQKWGLQHQTYLPPLEHPEAGLLGRWTFDEGEGDLVHDVSGNRKHGTMTNMHPINSWVDGAYGKALEFDGVDDNFTIPNLGDEYRTISMWIHPFNMYSKTLLSLIPDDGEKYVLDWASKGNQDPAGHFYFRSANNSTFLASGSSRYFNNYSWHHLTVKWDAGNIHYRLFADGIDRGKLGNNVNQTPLFSSGKLEISGYLGRIDDLRIYSRSLTDTEIKNICGDQDEDGLTDIREAELGTDPNVADTDGDGDSDSAEISAGTSPTDPMDTIIGKSLKSGLQVHLKFDETNGSIAYDSSGNNRHSTLNGVGGDGTTWKSGKIGGALRLDGIDDWGQIGYNLAHRDAFAMAMWIKTTSTVSTSPSNYSEGLGILTGPTDTFGMFINSGKFSFWAGTSSILRYRSTANVNDNLWYHIVGSRAQIENNRGFIYTALNGSVINHGVVNFSASTGTTLTLGRTQNGSIYFNGLIDDLRIYNRNLPADQVLSLYQLGL